MARPLDDGVSAADAEQRARGWDQPALFSADIVLVDPAVPGGSTSSARWRVDRREGDRPATSEAARRRSSRPPGRRRRPPAQGQLTPESLATSVRAAASGTGVVTPDLLEDLFAHLPENGATAGPSPPADRREQQVLALIAAGHPTREVAQELCYSERTVKNVLHDVVTKLNARSRSQAVAFAVREGLI